MGTSPPSRPISRVHRVQSSATTYTSSMSSSSIVPQKRTVEELVETYRSAVHDNPFDPPPSIRQLARDHVPKSTLAARINGRKSRKVAQIAFQTCTPEQEDIMVNTSAECALSAVRPRPSSFALSRTKFVEIACSMTRPVATLLPSWARTG